VEHQTDEPIRFETDRAKFLGRGRSLANPIALEQELSGSTGFVLDPIFSLRRTIVVEPGQHAHVNFITGAADSREKAVALAAHYRDPQASHRAFEAAWTHAQLDLRHLRIQPDVAQLFQQLASYVLFPHAHLRAPASRLRRNSLGQSRLWAYGISGDLPYVAVAIEDAGGLDLVREALQAHTFWRTRGLKVDLVILNQESASYEQPLQADLARLVAANSTYTGVDQPGGVFLRPAASVPEEDMTLLLTAARVVLIAARGSLSQQLGYGGVASRRTTSRPTVPAAAVPRASLFHRSRRLLA
jgi:cellobiose phosphorylase